MCLRAVAMEELLLCCELPELGHDKIIFAFDPRVIKITKINPTYRRDVSGFMMFECNCDL